MMRMIFIFEFSKKYLLGKKLRPIKDASLPSKSDVSHDNNYREIQRDHEGALYTQAIVPL